MEEKLICFCRHVTERQIIQTIQDGASDIEAIQKTTNACTGCRQCEFTIKDILNNNKNES